jgi:hypothetical protein
LHVEGVTMKTAAGRGILPCLLFAALLVPAARGQGTAEPPGTGDSVVHKVERAIEKGVHAAASGVERGAHAAAHGVRRGLAAAASGVEKGAQATARAASTVADTLRPKPKAEPPS